MKRTIPSNLACLVSIYIIGKNLFRVHFCVLQYVIENDLIIRQIKDIKVNLRDLKFKFLKNSTHYILNYNYLRLQLLFYIYIYIYFFFLLFVDVKLPIVPKA